MERFTLNTEVSSLDRDEIRTNLRNTKIGFVFQFHFLIKELTVMRECSFPLRKSGVPEKQALRKDHLSFVEAWFR